MQRQFEKTRIRANPSANLRDFLSAFGQANFTDF